MSISLAIIFSTIVLVGFFSTKTWFPKHVQFFMYFLLMFMYTSYTSVMYVNLEWWKINEEIAFRIVECIYVPFTIMWLINLLERPNRLGVKYGLGLLFLCLLAGMDLTLRGLEVYQYVEWNLFGSILAWILLFVIINLLRKLFIRLLQKEGIIQ